MVRRSLQVIMYDEPTAGLDPVASTVVEDLIRSLHADNSGPELNGGGPRAGIASYIVVTHQHSTIRRAVDRIIFLHEVWGLMLPFYRSRLSCFHVMPAHGGCFLCGCWNEGGSTGAADALHMHKLRRRAGACSMDGASNSSAVCFLPCAGAGSVAGVGGGV